MLQSLDPHQYLQDAELLYEQVQVETAIQKMADQLNIDYANETPVLLCVMTGAVVFTGSLLQKLTFPAELDYVQASRYQGNTSGQALNWMVKPKASIENRKILILDDILDEGLTLQAIVETCQSQGASEIKIAVLVDKVLTKAKPITADYIGLKVPDRYVFGYGMDIHGWWRNLPCIYATH